MKKLILLFLFMPLLNFSQVQIGNDIDGETTGDVFGWSVSLSSDGSIVAIGGPYNNSYTGHVRIYENQSNNWVQLGSDIIGEAASDRFGSSVSLSSDGSIVAIAAPYNDGNGNYSGHVRIYENQSNNWVQLGSDIDGEAAGDRFGFSVSLSSDGSIVAIGNENSSGHVRIYENQSNNWVQLGSDIDNVSAVYSVNLSSDGSIVALGAPGSTINSGLVRVYENQSNNWVQLGSDIIGEAIGDSFGYSVSLSSDGSIVAIGAPTNDGNGNYSGHVRVYENQLNHWVQLGSDIDGEAVNDRSGFSVSLSSDGSIVAIGTYQNNANGNSSGHVRIYENQLNNWVQLGSDIDGEAVNDWSGFSVSLSSDGSIVAIGAIGYKQLTGQVRIYDLSAVLSTESFKQNYFSFYPNPVKDILNIDLNKGLELKQVNIYNIQSQYLYSVKTSKIDVTNLSSGMYFIEVETNQGKSAKKIVVE